MSWLWFRFQACVNVMQMHRAHRALSHFVVRGLVSEAAVLLQGGQEKGWLWVWEFGEFI